MSNIINKKGIADNLAEKLDITKKDANLFVEAFLDEVKNNLEAKNTVDLAGFGKFEVVYRPERDGFNPKTKESIRIAATHVVRFRVSKALKDLVK